jgi:hypothetical protein
MIGVGAIIEGGMGKGGSDGKRRDGEGRDKARDKTRKGLSRGPAGGAEM